MLFAGLHDDQLRGEQRSFGEDEWNAQFDKPVERYL